MGYQVMKILFAPERLMSFTTEAGWLGTDPTANNSSFENSERRPSAFIA
jgi:hypothetical protein